MPRFIISVEVDDAEMLDPDDDTGLSEPAFSALLTLLSGWGGYDIDVQPANDDDG